MKIVLFALGFIFWGVSSFSFPDAQSLDALEMRQCLAASRDAYAPRLVDQKPWREEGSKAVFKSFSGKTGGVFGNTDYEEYGLFIGKGPSIVIAFAGTKFSCTNDLFTDGNCEGQNLQNEDYQDGRFQHHVIGGTSETGVGRCHLGFLKVYRSCSEFVRKMIHEHVSQTEGIQSVKDVQVTFTGHSLGGAVALLAASDVVNAVYERDNSKNNVRVVTFAAPLVFNEISASLWDDFLVHKRNHFRVMIESDQIPYLPQSLWARAHSVVGGVAVVRNAFSWLTGIKIPVSRKIDTASTGHGVTYPKPVGTDSPHALDTYAKALAIEYSFSL